MADLPDFRFPDAYKQYPFVNTGMDMFGPFYIEDKREVTQMHYVCLFTCLVTRAVHLEVCHDLSTDSLLMTIRRFVSRRGYPDLIVSDNGKNFIGAKQAMRFKFTNSSGQSETLSFPDSCCTGRVIFELQTINSCGLQHLRCGTTYSESLPSLQTSHVFETSCEQQPAVLR